MTRTWVVIATLVLALAGCQSHAAQADPIEAALDQEFVLHGGQQVAIRGADLRLRFTDVLEDSRCPTDVECFWTGQARIAVDAELGQDTPTSLKFNTNPAPGQTVTQADVAKYSIELLSLEPYPQRPENPIPFEDYRATFTVRKR